MRRAAAAFALLLLAACNRSGEAPAGEASGEAAQQAAPAPAPPAAATGAEETVAPARPAATFGYDSLYAPLDLDACTQVSQDEESGGATWRCKGVDGVPLLVFYGDERFDIDAGGDDGRFDTIGAFNSPGKTVEFRLHDGHPFAIIYRLVDASLEGKGSSVLFIDRIAQGGTAGCLVGKVDGATPQANAKARELADTSAAGFACGTSEPILVGPHTG